MIARRKGRIDASIDLTPLIDVVFQLLIFLMVASNFAKREALGGIYRIRRELAAQLLQRRGKQDLDAAVERWLQRRSEPVERYKLMVEEMRLRSAVDFATLSVAAQELRDLIYDRPVYDAREQ